jgi:hypothetical protein
MAVGGSGGASNADTPSGASSGAAGRGSGLDSGSDVDAGNGTCKFAISSPGTPACYGMCGNGTVDSCMEQCQHQGPCNLLQEDCDGAVPNGVTCEALGYTGGQLACTSWCAYDRSGCTSCVAPGGALLSCERPCVDTEGALSVSTAVASDTIGVAWTTWCSSCGSSYQSHFAAFDANLQVLFRARSPATMYPSLALAHSATQWLLVTNDAESSMTIHGFDDQGHPLGTHGIPSGADPVLGIRAGRAPLLLWTASSSDPLEGTVRQVALLTDDGNVTTTPVTLWPIAMSPSRASALYVGDGFLVAERVGTGIQTAHIALSGAVLSSNPLPFGESAESPRLVQLGQQVGIAYLDYSTTGVLKWAVLDKDGNVVTAPVPFSAQPDVYAAASFDVLSNDSGFLLVVPSATPPAQLSVATFDPTGHPLPDPLVIAKSGGGLTSPTLTRFGNDAVVSWLDGAQFNIGTLYLGMVALK